MHHYLEKLIIPIFNSLCKKYNIICPKKTDLITLVSIHPEWFEPEDLCMICYDPLKSDDFKLECCHKQIHNHCLKRCLENDEKCPHCRAIMKSEYRDKINDIKIRIVIL